MCNMFEKTPMESSNVEVGLEYTIFEWVAIEESATSEE